jgi:SAM-dependent methyltransferase
MTEPSRTLWRWKTMTASPCSDHFEARAVAYSRQVAPLFEAVYARVAQRLAEQSVRTVLDVGCGDGRFLQVLTLRGISATGLDRSSALLDLAAARAGDAANVSLVRGLAEALPFNEGAFDGTCCLMSLPHFDDPVAATTELGRVTSATGQIYMASFAGAVRDGRPVVRAPGLQAVAVEAGLGIEGTELVSIDAGEFAAEQLDALLAGATEPDGRAVPRPIGGGGSLQIYFQVITAFPERRGIP